jgi:predicted PurR-regulated permease PerM
MRRSGTSSSTPVQPVSAADIPGIRALLTLQVGVVVIVALMLAREVLIPITLAMLLSFLLAPLTSLLRRVRLGRAPASLVAVMLALGLITGLLWLIGAQMVSLGSNVSSNGTIIEHKLDLLRQAGAGSQWQAAERVRAQIEHLTSSGLAADTDAAPGMQPGPAKPVEVRQSGPTPIEVARDLAAGILAPLATAAIVLVVTMFILLQREDLRDRLIRLFGARDLHRTTRAINEAATRLSRYFITQLAVNAGFGCVIAIGLFLIGVPSPLLWGILTMLLRFVPYFGTILAALLPVLLAAAISPGWSMAAETALLFLVLEPLVGQVIEPVVIGRRTGLSPIAVIVAATFWTWLWGPVGLVLSTPLTLCCVAMGRHVERLEFLEVMFGDRPALSPVEGFYQRMLAGDPDEAVEQAERLLRRRSLSSYYDEVVIKGLRLASADAMRGVLGDAPRARMIEGVAELVEELDGYDDVDPPDVLGIPVLEAAPTASADDDTIDDESGLPLQPAPTGRLTPEDAAVRPSWRLASPVLCVAGAGALDEAACMVLGQVFGKHGIGIRTVPADATSRTEIASLDLNGVAMICICVLEAGAQAAHLRYVRRRLRRLAPGIPTMLVFWPQATEDDAADRRLRDVVDADLYADSLREAVTLCLHHAYPGGRLGEAERESLDDPATLR